MLNGQLSPGSVQQKQNLKIKYKKDRRDQNKTRWQLLSVVADGNERNAARGNFSASDGGEEAAR